MAQGSHWGQWQGQFMLSPEATYGTAMTTLFNFLPLTGPPRINMAVNTLEDAGSFGGGTAERNEDEFYQNITGPGVISIDFIADEMRVGRLARSFFNNITGATGAVTFGPGQNAVPAANSGLTCIWGIDSVAAQSAAAIQGTGGIVTKLSLSSSAGGSIRGSADISFLELSTASTLATLPTTALAGVYKTHSTHVLKFAGGSAQTPGSHLTEVTLEQPAVVYHGTALAPDAQLYGGPMKITGRIGLAARGSGNGMAQIANAITRSVRQLTLEWGTAAQAGYIKLDMDAALGEPTPEYLNGIAVTTFAFAQSKRRTAGTSTLLSIYTAGTLS